MVYEIGRGDLRVQINDHGAEIVSVRYRGEERSWQNENGSWAGHAPVLFPVCGHCGVTVDGVRYAMPPHGFARKSEFSCAAQSENTVSFVLQDSERTLAVYPFRFALTVTYTVDNDTVTIDTAVRNRGDRTLYFSLGGHDSFALSGDLENYSLRFEKEETFDALEHDEGGYCTGNTLPFGKGTLLRLPADFLQEGRTLILPRVRSRKVRLCNEAGRANSEISFAGFAHLLLWRPHGANMICIEPWLNLPDRAGEEGGDLSEKEDMQAVRAGQTAAFTRSIRYF